MVLRTEGFIDKVHQASSKLRDVINKGTADYNYYTGKTNSQINYSSDASPDEVKKSFNGLNSGDGDKLIKYFNRSNVKYTAKKDKAQKMLQFQFDVRNTPEGLINKFKPNGAYDKYITNFDDKEMIATLEIPLAESAMTPVPVPYKGYQCDKEGKLIKNIDLTETDNLKLSSPKIAYKDEDDLEGRLEIDINGKKYKYRVNPGVDMLTSEMIDKINSIRRYSDGKALAYLKKNMHEVTESYSEDLKNKILREVRDEFYRIAMSDSWGYENKEDIDLYLNPYFEAEIIDNRIRIEVRFEEGNYDYLFEMAQDLNRIITKYDTDAYFDLVDAGILEAYINYRE